jgi:hypothetical protein
MNDRRLHVAIDIGTTKVCTIIGEETSQQGLEILGVGSHPSFGLKKGSVINIEKTVRSILNSIEEAKLMAGINNFTSATIGVAGNHIYSFNSSGVVSIKNRMITEEDVERVSQMIGDTFVIFKDIVEKSRKFTPEQLEQIFKAKTFYGLKALELNMVDQIAMGYEFVEELELKHNIWICYKEKESKSLVNSLLYENVKNIGIGLSKYYQHVKTHNQVDNIKLL